MTKNLGGLDSPVNEAQGGTNATSFDGARTNMGLNALINSQTAGYTALASDRGKLIHYTGGGGVTLDLTASATLLNGWSCIVRNDAGTAITIDPNGAEQINGASTLSLDPSQAVIVYCDGSSFYTEGEAVQRVALSGSTMTGPLILSGDPVTALGAVTKQYADALSSGLNIVSPCYAATTANLNATYANGAAGVGATLTNAGALAAFSTDGTSPPINSRILVRAQTSSADNGIYTLTTVGSGAVAWVLTRATDYDQAPGEIFPGNFVITNNGTLYANAGWIQTATVATIGTDPIAFSQFGSNNFAPPNATYILQTPNGSLTSAQALSALATGLVKNTTTTGVLSIAVQGTDYYKPGGTPVAVTDGGTGTNAAGPTAANNIGALAIASNLSDVASASTSLSNLGGAASATTITLNGTANEIASSAGAQSLASNRTWTLSLPSALTFTGKTITGGAYASASATSFTFTSGTMGTAVTGTTQAPLTNNTTMATTAYVDAAVAAAIGGSGALVLLSTQTASNSASINFDNMLNSTYDDYLLVYSNFVAINNATTLLLQVGTGAGPTYQTSSYVCRNGIVSSSSVSSGSTTVTNGFSLANQAAVNNTSTHGAAGSVTLYDVNDGTNFKSLAGTGKAYSTTGPSPIGVLISGEWQGSTVLTSARFICDSGNISTGTFKLYGIKK